jgi:hypothetical protein
VVLRETHSHLKKQERVAMELATHRTVFNCLGHEVIEVFGAWF